MASTSSTRHWMPDSSCKNCTACSAAFSLFLRKHHCRCCGRIFCASCSAKTMDGSAFGLSDAVRVCDACKRLEPKFASDQSQADELVSAGAVRGDVGGGVEDLRGGVDTGSSGGNYLGADAGTPGGGGASNDVGFGAGRSGGIGTPEQSRGGLITLLSFFGGGSTITESDQISALRVNVGAPNSLSPTAVGADRTDAAPRASPEKRHLLVSPYTTRTVFLSAHSEPTAKGYDLSVGVGGGIGIADDRARLVEPLTPLFSKAASPAGILAFLSLVGFADAALSASVRRNAERLFPQSSRNVWTDAVLRLARRSVIAVDPNVRAGDLIDIRAYVRIKVLPSDVATPGGECEIVPGIVFKHRLPNKSMRSTIADPRVLLVDDSLGFEHLGSGDVTSGAGKAVGANDDAAFVSFETLLEQERKYTELLSARVLALRPDVIFSTRPVSSMLSALLLRSNVVIVPNVKQSTLHWLSRVSGARILSSVNFLNLLPAHEVIGTNAAGFSATASATPRMPLISLTGSPEHLGVTVLLRGGPLAELRAAKFALRTALPFARDLRLFVATALDFGLRSPPLLEVLRRAMSALAAVGSASTAVHPSYFAGGVGNTCSTADELSSRDAILLRANAAATTSASMAAWAALDEAAIERGCVPARLLLVAPLLPPHLALSVLRLLLSIPNTMRLNILDALPPPRALLCGAPSDVPADARARFLAAISPEALLGALASEVRILLRSEKQSLTVEKAAIAAGGVGTAAIIAASQTPFPTSVASAAALLGVSLGDATSHALLQQHNEGGESLAVSVCSVNVETLAQCSKPRVRVVHPYGQGDKVLGAFLAERCFDESNLCKVCGGGPSSHSLTFVHGTARLAITVHRLTTPISTASPLASPARLGHAHAGPLSALDAAQSASSSLTDSLPVAHAISANPAAAALGTGWGADIMTWAYCAICKRHANAVTKLSRGAATFSFGRLLEFYLIGAPTFAPVEPPRNCSHAPTSFLRYFSRGRWAAAFRVSGVQPLVLRVHPPLSSNTKHTSDITARIAAALEVAAHLRRSVWGRALSELQAAIDGTDAALMATVGTVELGSFNRLRGGGSVVLDSESTALAPAAFAVASPTMSLPAASRAGNAAERARALLMVLQKSHDKVLADIETMIALTAHAPALNATAFLNRVVGLAVKFDSQCSSTIVNAAREILAVVAFISSHNTSSTMSLGKAPHRDSNSSSGVQSAYSGRSEEPSNDDDSDAESNHTNDDSLEQAAASAAARAPAALEALRLYANRVLTTPPFPRRASITDAGVDVGAPLHTVFGKHPTLSQTRGGVLIPVDAAFPTTAVAYALASDSFARKLADAVLSAAKARARAPIVPAAPVEAVPKAEAPEPPPLPTTTLSQFVGADSALEVAEDADEHADDGVEDAHDEARRRRILEVADEADVIVDENIAIVDDDEATAAHENLFPSVPLELSPLTLSAPEDAAVFILANEIGGAAESASKDSTPELKSTLPSKQASGSLSFLLSSGLSSIGSPPLSPSLGATSASARAPLALSPAELLRSEKRVDIQIVFSDRNPVAASVAEGGAPGSLAELSDGNSNHFVVTAYWAMQFAGLRSLTVDGGDGAVNGGFLESIAFVDRWAASGGASGAKFERSADRRTVTKLISRTEFDMFVGSIASGYFKHMADTILDGAPSVLARILGVFKVTVTSEEWRDTGGYGVSAEISGIEDGLSPTADGSRTPGANAGGGTARSRVQKVTNHYVLIMENIFYTRSILPGHVFDIKGKLRAQKRTAPAAVATAPDILAESLPQPRRDERLNPFNAVGADGNAVAADFAAPPGSAAAPDAAAEPSTPPRSRPPSPPRTISSPMTSPLQPRPMNDGEGLVLLDGDLVAFSKGAPLPLTEGSKRTLDAALSRDTRWLISESVVDYSLLIGVEPTTGVLSLGIIDYVRCFDIVKRLETNVKTVTALVTNVEATVVEPVRYAERLQRSVNSYLAYTPCRLGT